jgi:hypothetical protein
VIDAKRRVLYRIGIETKAFGQRWQVDGPRSGDGLRRWSLDLWIGMPGRLRPDKTQRIFLHRDREARFPDRQSEVGLVECDGRQIELMLLAEQTVLDFVRRRFLLGRRKQMLQLLLLQSQQSAVPSKIFACCKLRRPRIGGNVARVRKCPRNTVVVTQDLGL